MTLPVEISNLSKCIAGFDIIKNINFRIPHGRCVALVGHNGAGKTTLMKMILGLSRPTSGMVKVFGKDPSHARARGRIGFLPENVYFSPALTGHEILAYYARLKGERPSACLALLERVGLSEAGSRFLNSYSKGMRQRLGLAQALIGAPRLLLLDEPTTGLDAPVRETFYEIIAELRNSGATVLLSSHSLTELEGRTDRIIIMRQGTIVADGSVEELQEISQLPLRLCLEVREGQIVDQERLGPAEQIRMEGRQIELLCSRKNKMQVLRTIFENKAPINDIVILPPTLDQLYAYFLQQEGCVR